MDRDPPGLGQGRDLGDGLDHAGVVVCQHHRDQDDIRGQRRPTASGEIRPEGSAAIRVISRPVASE